MTPDTTIREHSLETDPAEYSAAVCGVAHDLNNQIMILLNSLDRIIILNPDADDARLALKAAEHCAELTAQLLPHARPRPVVPAVSVRQIIAEAAALVRPLLPPAIRLEINSRANCCIAADSPQLQRALVNLCLNAIEAINGPGVIRLSADLEPNSVCLSVTDTGPGVPPELREHIFDPLFTTEAAHGGNGLGLSRVRETIEQLGGSITLHDVLPHGACFRLHLPV